MLESISFDNSIELTGHEVAQGLADICNAKVRQSFINSFLQSLRHEDYEMVCKFVKENPPE
jgi:hypothetical protein